MEIELLPVSRIYGGGLFFDGGLAGDVLDAYLEWTETVPDGMGSSVALIPFPDLPQVPEVFRGGSVSWRRCAPPVQGSRSP